MLATSSKFKSLRVGAIKFVDGKAEVSEAQASALLALPAEFEVTVDGESKVGTESDDEAFDPSGHNAEEVRAYLAGLDDSDTEAHGAEVIRVLEAEKAGKDRKGIIEFIEGAKSE